jgi:hypothetical protein
MIPVNTAKLPIAEDLHKLYTQCRQAAKRFRICALAAEVAAVTMISARVLTGELSPWMPAAILFLTVSDVLLREYVKHLRRFGQECRRLSLSAYLHQTDVEPATACRMQAESPSNLRFLAWKSLTLDLNEYYAITGTSLDSRRREIYTQTVFYSWKLTSIYAQLLLFVGFLLTTLSGIALYVLAISDSYRSQERTAIIEALFTIILVFTASRVFETTLHFFSLAGQYRGILQGLLTMPSGKHLEELTAHYDFIRAGGEDVPTIIFLFLKRGLERKWLRMRGSVVSGV